MANSSTSHAISKWLANKSPKLNFYNRRSKSKSSSSSPPSPSPSPSVSPSSPSSPASSNDSKSPRNGDKHRELTREVFRRFDENDDGKISALELRSYFGSIGEYMSHQQAESVIEDFDADGDGLLDFQEFVSLIERDSDRRDEDLRSAFEMFELEDGCITPKSVQRMLCRLGDTRSFDDCKAMVRAFDKDGNGVLDFTEFHQMMTA